MQAFLRKLLRFRVTSALFLVSLILVLGSSLWAYGALRKIHGPIIVHFSSLGGIDQIGEIWDLLRIGVLGLVVISINFFIAFELEERDWFLGKLTAAVTVFLSLLIFIGFAAIISVN